MDRWRPDLSHRRLAGSDMAHGVARLEETMHETLTTMLAALRRRFEGLYSTRLVEMRLLGSQARGDADPGSDLDVLVVLRGEVSACEEIARTIEDVADVSLHHNEVVSCVFVSAEQVERERSPLWRNIRREGVPI